MRSRRIHIAVLVSTVMICGCGQDFGNPVTVTGKVTQGGTPVADADVTFQSQRKEIPAASRTRIGKTDSQGAFSIGEVYPGDYEVWVVKTQLNPEMAPAEAVATTDPLAKFGPGTSPLKATVGDKTEFSYELNDY